LTLYKKSLAIRSKVGNSCQKNTLSTNGNKKEISTKVLHHKICFELCRPREKRDKNKTIRESNKSKKEDRNLNSKGKTKTTNKMTNKRKRKKRTRKRS